jgi:signal transduction histidine kinase
MLEFIKNLFASDFMAHGHCYFWRPEIVWLHVASDSLIALAYYSIPIALIYFVRKRRDLPFHWMFLMFGAFILSCGTTHAMEVWTIWNGTYRIAGVLKAITAGLSLGTAAALVPLMPQALALPSPARLESANRKLEREIANRLLAEDEIKKLNEVLEQRVAERTAQLEAANHQLRAEIAERIRAVDEHRQLEARMQQSQKLESLGLLAGGIAHDFNNLLVGILGNSGLALGELKPESSAYATVEQIQAAAQRAAELTNQLLAYSGKGRFLVQPLDLSRQVEEIAHLLKISTSKKAALRTRLASGLPAVEADPVQIQQVVMNLITNASEALGDNAGEIVVKTGVVDLDGVPHVDDVPGEPLPAGRYVYLEVSDNGCGMDKETRARIFDPFFTTKFTGRGLGLAAVMGIVRGHRGAIHVYSEPGRGTAFKVLFPASQQAVPAARRAAEATAAWQGTGTILIVDDEEGVRRMAGLTLENAGFKVLRAADGRAGVQMFQEHAGEIAAILLDLTMPEMSGEEVFRAIRSVRPDARIILSSGYSQEETINLFPKDAPAGFIQKPYMPAKLVEKVREILAH